MGTRCDFYAGRGLDATYLGSIGHDAYVDAMAEQFAGVADRQTFDERLKAVFAEYGEIAAANGWPWPWDTSDTTDTVVAFDAGRCWTAHHGGCWAPLDDAGSPTVEPCVFPNMRERLLATPQGRLSQRLRHGTEMRMGPPEAVMATLLCYVGTLLSQMFLHSFWKDGCLHVLKTFVSRERHAMELKMVASAVAQCSEDFDLLLAECRNCMSEEAWDLLVWLRECHGHLETEEVDLTLGPDVPVYFGTAAPVAEHHRTFDYVKFTDPQAGRVHAAWQQLLDRAPIVYAQPLASAMLAHGALPVRRSEAVAWLSEARAEFGGKDLLDACRTLQGREQARAWAGARVFED